MIPLSSPTGYWRKLHSAVSKYICNRKCPYLKSTTIGRRSDRGLAVPNFKLYYWSLVLRTLITWFAVAMWLTSEERVVCLVSLSGVLFANISHSQCQLWFEPIIAQVF